MKNEGIDGTTGNVILQRISFPTRVWKGISKNVARSLQPVNFNLRVIQLSSIVNVVEFSTENVISGM